MSAKRIAVALSLAIAALLMMLAGAAQAKVVHLEEGSIDGHETSKGAIEQIWGLATDSSSGATAGDVYALEVEDFNGSPATVYRFDEDGTYTGVAIDGSATPAGFFSPLDIANNFSFANPLAVDGSGGPKAGDLYVADVVNKVVDVFTPAGAYVCQITGQASPSASECGSTGSATPEGGISPSALAVDPTDGSIAIGDASGRIYRYDEDGEYLSTISDSHVVYPGSIDFNASGEMFVVSGNAFFGGESVSKFDASGTFVSVLPTIPSPVAVGVDRGGSQIYVSSEESIHQYTEAGDDVSTIAVSSLNMAVAGGSGRLYTAPFAAAASQITIWGAPVVIPDATTEAPSAVEDATAVLHGTVDPAGGGEVESCEFEYGTSTSYGQSAPCAPAVPYASATPATASVSGLSASTEYHFRIVASNANGVESPGGDQTFITKGPPTVASESVDAITRTSAEFHGSINPHGYSTSFAFEYVDQAQYEIDGFDSAQETPPVVVGSQETDQPVSAPVEGLTVGTKYHYRLVATSSHGTDRGADQSFETIPVVELDGQYSRAGIHSARVEAEVNPMGLNSSCAVEWVTDAEFQSSGYANATVVDCDPAQISGSSPVEPRAQFEGLDISSIYHFRFTFTNSSGTLRGSDQEVGTFGIKDFSVEAIDEIGSADSRAGGHPYELVTRARLNTTKVKGAPNNERIRPTAVVKDILAELPPGLIGNPTAVPKCTRRVVEETRCGGDAQVGTMTVVISGGGGELGTGQEITRGIFNTYPPKGKPASFASNYFNVSINGFVEADVRTGRDYGITAGATNIIEIANVFAVEVRMWGVPADESHDGERECAFVKDCASNVAPKPFLRNPTSCQGPLTVRAIADSYNAPGQFVSASDELPAITGCNQLEFAPSIEARPTTKVSDSPSGLHVKIRNPQNEDPEGLGTPDLRKAVVTLPEGMTVNPAGANGLQGCSPAQVELHGPKAASCPDGSKIGTAEVDTPMLDHPLKGGVYLATPRDNPFGSLLAIYIALDDPQSGVVVKLAGHVEADPNTGRLKTTFDENPQLPFNDFKVDFFSGALAPLRTPGTCGTFTTHSELTPWSAPDSGPAPTPSDSYRIDSGPNGSGCASSLGAQPNSPSFDAGTESPIAAKYSPFVVRLNREDGSQEFKDVTIEPPAGLLAKLAGTPYCSDSSLAAAANRSGNEEKSSPSCPSASQIGIVNVAAGAGPSPYWTQGRAYLAGPYRGAPLSLAIVTPATAGPFDLGTVVVRSALRVDPETTRITAVTDSIPHILEGIPLDIRTVVVKLDKPGFTLNPTSCDPMSVGGRLGSVLGQSAGLANRFQVGDCTSLGFQPKLNLRLFGKTGRGGYPKLRAVLTMPEGNANIATASVRLPHSEFLAQNHIRTICTRVQFAADSCPQGSIYGYARAWSPLLAEPLQGPVYLRSSSNKLPDLVADLRGQIHVAVVGRIDSVKGGIRNTFEMVPDAPVSKFMLTMRGGSKGLLQNSTNICKGTHKATVQFDAHSGAVHDIKPILVNRKCRKAKARKHRRHNRGGAKRVASKHARPAVTAAAGAKR